MAFGIGTNSNNGDAGIPTIEYDYTLIANSRNIQAWLIFYQTEGRWVLNFR